MKAAQTLVLRWLARYQAGGGGIERFRVACNFTPSCSEYTRQAVIRFGVWRGLSMGWRRLRRCRSPDLTVTLHDPVPPAEPR